MRSSPGHLSPSATIRWSPPSPHPSAWSRWPASAPLAPSSRRRRGAQQGNNRLTVRKKGLVLDVFQDRNAYTLGSRRRRGHDDHRYIVKLAEHRDLVAAVALGAMDAIAPDLQRKAVLRHNTEAQPLEEALLVGERHQLADTQP